MKIWILKDLLKNNKLNMSMNFKSCKPTKQWHKHLDYEITNLTQFERFKSDLERKSYEGLKSSGNSVITRILHLKSFSSCSSCTRETVAAAASHMRREWGTPRCRRENERKTRIKRCRIDAIKGITRRTSWWGKSKTRM